MIRQRYLLLAAPLLLGQAPPHDSVIAVHEIESLPTATLARKVLGEEGRRVTERWVCAAIPGTFCTGGPLGLLVLSTDFVTTRYPTLCMADRWEAHPRNRIAPDTAIAIFPLFRHYRIFRSGPACAGSPRTDPRRHEFTVDITDRAADARDAWNGLLAARNARIAIARRSTTVKCKVDTPSESSLCVDPAAILADEKLDQIREMVINRDQKSRADSIALNIFDDRQNRHAMLVTVHLKLTDRYAAASTPKIASVDIEEHLFVD